jgi:hypothetical protein
MVDVEMGAAGLQPETPKGKPNGQAIPGPASAADIAAASVTDAETGTETSPAPEDRRIADLEDALALDDEEGVSNAQPQSLIIAVGKPPDFFMVHPDPRMSQIVSGLFAPGMSKTFYLVGADVRGYLSDYLGRVHLVLCVDMNDDEFLWPIKLPKMPGDELNDWSKAAMKAVQKARVDWHKLIYVEGVNGYKIEPRVGAPVLPAWSGRSWAEIRNQALADYVIKETKHPVAKRLREGKSRRGG